MSIETPPIGSPRATAVAAGVLAALVLAAALALAPPALGQAPAAPCRGLPSSLGARCGAITVPLDRADPGLGTTTVAYALVPRRRASSPSLGTVLYNPGGPGSAPIALAADLARGFGPLLERRDLLLVDPRGTGRSAALTCPAAADPAIAFAPRSRFIAVVGACGARLGARVRAYGSAAVADDFDAVRAVLGLDRLDLWGDSYGTYLMPVYAARHPQRVRSVVLSGAYPIAFDPWGLDRLGAARRAIRLTCARTRACRAATVLRDIGTVAARLRRHPVFFRVRVGDRRLRARLDEAAVAELVYGGGNASLFGVIPAAMASARDGDLALLRRFVESSRLALAAQIADPALARLYSITQSFATQCHDYPRVFSYADPPAARRRAYLAARRAVDPRAFAPLSAAAWTRAGFEAVDRCISWPNDPTAAPPLAPGAALPDVPTLVLSGDLDTNTPSVAGRQAAAQFPRATFAEVPNAGHGPTAGPCGLRLALRFVATLTADPAGCRGTGTPPAIVPRVPVRAAALTPVRVDAARDSRLALAVVVATLADLDQQAPLVQALGTARALRGGTYRLRGGRRVVLDDARVVRDASVSGTLRAGDRTTTGTVTLKGAGVPDGRLRLSLAATGRGRAVGILGGAPVTLRFRVSG